MPRYEGELNPHRGTWTVGRGIRRRPIRLLFVALAEKRLHQTGGLGLGAPDVGGQDVGELRGALKPVGGIRGQGPPEHVARGRGELPDEVVVLHGRTRGGLEQDIQIVFTVVEQPIGQAVVQDQRDREEIVAARIDAWPTGCSGDMKLALP